VAGSYEHTNEPPVSIECREFIEYMMDYELFKKIFGVG
jgi:hypothetical protein